MKILEVLKLITDGLKSISLMKRPESIIEEVAEKKDIQNKTRKKRHELRQLKLDKKIRKFNEKYRNN